MKQTTKRLLALILALSMCFSLLSANVWARAAFEAAESAEESAEVSVQTAEESAAPEVEESEPEEEEYAPEEDPGESEPEQEPEESKAEESAPEEEAEDSKADESTQETDPESSAAEQSAPEQEPEDSKAEESTQETDPESSAAEQSVPEQEPQKVPEESEEEISAEETDEGKSENVDVQSQQAVYEKLIALKSRFPAGMYYDHYVSQAGYDAYVKKDEQFQDVVTDFPCNHNANYVGNYDCNYFDGGSQCWGFACKLFYEVFGIRASGMAKKYDKNISIGDWIRLSSEHSGIVLSISGNNFTMAEANIDYKGKIGWGSITYSKDRISYYKHASNYDDIVPPRKKGERMATGYDRTIPDGDYLIANAGTTDKTSFYYLDIEGTAQPASNKTNVSLCGPLSGTSEIPSYEIWTLIYNDGFYMITQKDSSAALDVWMDGINAGENVQAWETNYSDTQKWAISTNGRNGYRLQAKSSGFSLDVAGGGTASGTNVQQYPGNDADAQSWVFIPYRPSQPIENGRYILLSAVDESLELDVSGDTGDIPGNTNVQIWKDSCPSKYNSFDFTRLDNGYYKVTHAASGKALDVTNGQSNYGTNVCVQTQNGTVAQQWSVTKNGNYYYLRARCNGYALDLKGSGTENGTNVEVFPFHGGANQSWKFVRAEYAVNYNANGGTGAPATQTKYYKENLTLSTSTPVRSNYDFKGWNTRADGKGKTYSSGVQYDLDKDITLYAQWKMSPCKTHAWNA